MAGIAIAAIRIVFTKLPHFNPADIRATFTTLPSYAIPLSPLAVPATSLVFTLYDRLGGHCVGRIISHAQTASIAPVMSYNVGLSILGGMAPLAEVEAPLAPTSNRVGTFTFERGESFCNLQGLRQYKEKFAPNWEPRYIATIGGARLPTIDSQNRET